MLTCKKATQLMSQQLDRPLSRMETLSLRFHLLMCHGCRNFEDQMAFLRNACKRAAKAAGEN